MEDTFSRDNRHHAQGQPVATDGAWVRPPDRPDMAPIAQLAIAYPFLTVMWLFSVMSSSPGYELLGTIFFIAVGPPFAMGVAVAVGLPLRLNRRLSRWWVGNWWVYCVLAATGLAMLVWGYNTPERQVGDIDGYHYDVITRSSGLLFWGSALLTFLAVNAGFRRSVAPLTFRPDDPLPGNQGHVS